MPRADRGGHTGPAQSGDQLDPGPGDIDAHVLFGKVAKAYQSLTSYSDQGQFIVAMTLGGKAHRQVRPLKLAFVRPNKFDLDAGAVRLTSDGKTMTTVIEPLKKYMTAPAPETVGINTFREGPTGAMLFGGQTAAPTAAPMFVLLSLLTGTNPDVMLDQMGGTLHARRRPVTARPDKAAILIDLQEGPDLLLRVDPATKLLSAIELKIDPAQLAKSAPPGQTLSIDQFGWTAGAVSTSVAPERSFAFVAPKGFTPIEGQKEQAGGAGPAPQYAVQEKIGKPAPDFTLTLLDGPGKIRTMTRADLAGKVVLIDFWATWCGPCLMELPEIQKLIEHYKDAKKDVLVVALSQDSEPQEISEVRKRVEKTLADKKINLTDRHDRPDRAGPEQLRGQGVRRRGIPDAGDPRRQGDRPVGPRRLQPRRRRAPAQVAGHRDRRAPRGQVAGGREGQGQEGIVEEMTVDRRTDRISYHEIHEIHEKWVGESGNRSDRTVPTLNLDPGDDRTIRRTSGFRVFRGERIRPWVRGERIRPWVRFLRIATPHRVLDQRRVPTGSRSRTVMSRVPRSWL